MPDLTVPRRLITPRPPGTQCRVLTPRRLITATVLAAVVAYALLWPLVAPAGWAETDYLRGGLAPGWPHLMGTDALGHDLSVRVAQALRVSLSVAAGAALAAVAIGVAVGAAAAAGGARVDALLMRATDAVAAVPHLLATVVVVALFRGSITAVVVALAATHWPPVARIVRAQTQRVMASGFVAASRVAGAGPAQLVRHHVVPAVAGQAGLAVVVMLPHAVWHESTLSFLGIGLPPEVASLGTLIAMSRSDLLIGRWWALVFPAAALVLVTVAVALLAPGRSPLGSGRSPGRRGPGACREPRTARRSRRGVAHVHAPADASDDYPEPDPDPMPCSLAVHPEAPVVLEVSQLTVRYPAPGSSPGRPPVTALTEVSLSVPEASVVAVVGGSGAGKSTVADACSGMLPGSARITGSIAVNGSALQAPSRPRVGHVPQSTADAFTPTRHVRTQIEEVLAATGLPQRHTRGGRARIPLGAEVDELCLAVGLDTDVLERYPHQLSGGQLRRAAIAAALATDPAVLIADEPTVGLDGPVASDVLHLLGRLTREHRIAVMVISHDSAALDSSGIVDHTVVLRDGRVTEQRGRLADAEKVVSP